MADRIKKLIENIEQEEKVIGEVGTMVPKEEHLEEHPKETEQQSGEIAEVTSKPKNFNLLAWLVFLALIFLIAKKGK